LFPIASSENALGLFDCLIIAQQCPKLQLICVVSYKLIYTGYCFVLQIHMSTGLSIA